MKTFKTTKVELKSVWLRNPKHLKKQYLKKYKLTKEQLIEFIENYYQIVNKYAGSIEIMSVVFNKMGFSEKKRITPDGNPFLKSTQVMLDRLAYIHEPLEVTIDQMENNLRKTNGKNGKMFRVFSKQESFQIDFKVDYKKIVDVIFKKSFSENFLQMADLCGYNIYRQFVDNGCYIETGKHYEFFGKILKNFRSKSEKIDGYGLVILGINKKSRKVRDFLKSVSSTDTHIV